MYAHEKKALMRIKKQLKERLHDRIISIYAFGSKVRGDHNEWSDFDVLVVVRNKTPELESEIIGLFVDEEIESGLSFTPVIKDIKAFELEKRFNTPFYGNITREGVLL